MRYVKTILFLTLVFLFNACSTGDTVYINEFFPLGKVEKLTTIKIEFSENLAPADIQDKWLDDEFIEFEPKIEGKFKWTSPSTLIFSPEYALEPIQKYKAKVTKKVLFGSKLSTDFETYEFYTPDFDVTKVEFFWTQVPNESYKISVQANIHFNYAVVPDRVHKYLEVELAGSPLPDYKVMSENASDIIAVNFGEIKQADKAQRFLLKVKSGLESIVGKKPLEDTREFEHKLPPITKLAVTGVTSGFSGTTGWIEVRTTQTVDQKRLKDFVSINPSKPLTFFVNENKFRIETNLSELKTVDLKIKKGLPGLYGGELEFDFEQVVSLVDVNPSINFSDKKGKYLMLGGEENLQLNAVNVPGVDIEVSQVFKNNLVHFLDNHDYYYDSDYSYYNPNYYVGNFGKKIYDEKIDLQNNQNWLQKIDVNLNKALNQRYKGIYVINARSSKERWIHDSKMIAISDLGIIVKKASNELLVFVNSISKAEPVEGVEINLISRSNQVLLSGKTDPGGVIRFSKIKEAIDNFYPRLVTAEKEEDFNYIDLAETNIETSRFDVGGITEYSDTYNAFIYSARNLYRPGETVNLSGIIRDKEIKLVGELPIIVKIITPTGKIFDEFKQVLNEQGSFELSYKVPEFAQTGGYTAEVYSGSEHLIGTYSYSVEEFVPDKIRVTLKNEKETAFPGETVSIDTEAEFLFGSRAAGLKYEVVTALKHRPFRSKTYPKHNFGNSSIINSNIEETYMDGTLDDRGHAQINYIVPEGLQSGGIITGAAYVSVFDLTGRTVTRAAGFDVFTKESFIGINAPGYYFGTNEQLTFNFAAVDYKDKPINNFSSGVELIKYEWQTVLKKDNSNRYYYASEQKEIKIWTKDFVINKSSDFTFSLNRSGKYEIRVYEAETDQYVSKTFYAYGWGGSTASTFEVDKEGRIDIVFDKEIYSPGDNAKILFTTPFSGKMLVTVERNGVYHYEYVDIKNKSTELNLNISEQYMPNVYVTATLFKEHNMENSTPFLVGHGFASMKVEKKENRLALSIEAPSKIKPKTKQKIVIKTKPQKNIFVTLAAVDEGILQIKNYATPDPYGYMYAKRRLSVNSYDLYKLLLPEIVKGNLSPGGDRMAAELQKRSNPVKAKRFELVSIWSGIKKTGSDGKVEIELNIPQFNGDIRLMALAYSGPAFGSAEKSMKVADDIIIQPEIPRFLAPNDLLVSNVTLINTTAKKGKVDLKLSVNGPLKVIDGSIKSIEVEGNSTANVSFKIKADSTIGKGKIVFQTSGKAEVKEEIEIAVRPVSPLVVESGSGTIEEGADVKIQIPSDFLEGTQNTSLTISKFPAVKFAKHLKYLVGYPHGCIEQTVSKLFPQLYFEEIAKLIAPEMYKTNNPVYYVREGIRKIESMQRYDGSMSYWQGGDYTSWWGSVYAAHFLIEAKKAGYPVAETVLNNVLKYVSQKAKEKSTYDYVYYRHNSRNVIKIASKEIPYSLYVLALAGKGDISTMNYYKARLHLLSNDSKYLLAGAYALMGKWNSYNEVIPPSYSPEITERLTGGSFDSEIRANSIMLNVLLEVEPQDEQVPFLIKHITQIAERMYSTQERSFAFLALGKAAKLNADTKMKVDIILNGENLRTINNKDFVLDSKELNRAEVVLRGKGKGEMYYFWNTEGVKINGKVNEEDSNMKVRRTYFDYRARQPIMNNEFEQGQLIVCKISLTGFERSAENIVITDMLPAGFEIENPRLSKTGDLTWNSSNRMNVQYMDIRDDRLLLFTDLQRNKEKEFYYMIRVVSKGKFQLPVIGAEAMYDREFRSYNGAGKVIIE